MNTASFESTLRSYSITGNPYADSLIYSQLISVVFAFSSTMTRVFKKVFMYFIRYFGGYVKNKLMTGSSDAELVFYTEIRKANALFYNFTMNTIIKNDDIKSDKNSTQFMDIFQKFMEEKKDGNPTYSWYGDYYSVSNKKWKAEYELHINSDVDNDKNKLSYSKSFKNQDLKEDICKTFVEGDLIIKMALVNADTDANKIEITIFQLKNENSKNFRLDMFEQFLQKRFNFRSKVPIIQTVIVTHKDLVSKINDFISVNRDRSLSSTARKLTCGDKDHVNDDETKDTILNNFSSIKLKTKDNHDIVFDDSIKDYTNKLDYETYHSTSFNNEDSFDAIYNKYIGETISDPYGYYCGFFYFNGRTVLIYFNNNMYLIKVISHSSFASLEEIQTLVNGIFTGKLSNRKKIKAGGKKNKVHIYKRVDGSWSNYELDIRTFDSIYLPNALMNEISREFEKFSQMKQLYKLLEISYRKGILFYGPPGTGKTSLVKALAYEHQLNIYVINVNDSDINDDSIGNILSSIGKSGSKILLFEDIDSAFSDKEMVKNETKVTYEEKPDDKKSTSYEALIKAAKDIGKKDDDKSSNNAEQGSIALQQQNNKFLTYSGLLNALDGVLSGHEGVITVMTTNYIDKLGEAFLRPGRIDRKFMLTYCNKEQIYKMLDNLIKQRLRMMQLSISKHKAGINDNGIAFEIENEKINNKYKDHDFKKQCIENFCEIVMESGKQYTPAQMQQYLIRNSEVIDDIFQNVNNIRESYDCKYMEDKPISIDDKVEKSLSVYKLLNDSTIAAALPKGVIEISD